MITAIQSIYGEVLVRWQDCTQVMMPPGSQKKEYKKDIVTGTSSSVIEAAVAMAAMACAGKVRIPVGLA